MSGSGCSGAARDDRRIASRHAPLLDTAQDHRHRPGSARMWIARMRPRWCVALPHDAIWADRLLKLAHFRPPQGSKPQVHPHLRDAAPKAHDYSSSNCCHTEFGCLDRAEDAPAPCESQRRPSYRGLHTAHLGFPGGLFFRPAACAEPLRVRPQSRPPAPRADSPPAPAPRAAPPGCTGGSRRCVHRRRPPAANRAAPVADASRAAPPGR